jgi:peptidoglycan hydrolase-like protein with peptidoglycan-binding domain
LPIATRISQLASLFFMLLITAGLTSATTTTAKAKPKHAQLTSTHSSSSHHSTKHTTKAVAHTRGQHGIDEERTVAIQSALIREHYLTGDPTGVWDDSSKAAMLRYQAANGWQTKITPDSRALIKLGLGPDHKGLLNPETANIPSPHELGVDSETQPGGAADQQ